MIGLSYVPTAPYALHGSGLGDVVCVEGDCTFGRGAVAQLKGAYAAAGSPAGFKMAYDAIIASADAIEARWFAKNIPFSTLCCDYKQIGAQAQDLMGQIAVSRGQASLLKTDTQGLSDKIMGSVGTFLKILAGVAITGVVVYGGATIYNSTRAMARSPS